MMKEIDMNKDHNFLARTDLSDYAGQWVAVCEERIVSHGEILKNVIEQAKVTCGSRQPLLFKVPNAGVLIL